VSLESNEDSKSRASSQTFDKTSKRTISSSHSKPRNSEKYSTLQRSKIFKNSKDKIPSKKQTSSGKLEQKKTFENKPQLKLESGP